MKQAIYNKDKHAWKRWRWDEIIFTTACGIATALWIIFVPAGWWL